MYSVYTIALAVGTFIVLLILTIHILYNVVYHRAARYHRSATPHQLCDYYNNYYNATTTQRAIFL